MQRALDSLLKIYLQQETRAELGGSTKNNAETYKFGIEEEPVQPEEEEEFLRALYNCLEEKGVMREMQAFLRQKLVNILKGVWPNLVSTRCEGNLGRVTTMLIEDFMCSHKLLFTYSVLATELDEGVTVAKGNFGKMPFAKAETLLADIGIKKESKLSRTLLKRYSENGDWSLLECIIDSKAWCIPKTESTEAKSVNELNMSKENEKKNMASIDEKMRQINEKYYEKTKNITSASIEEKLRNLTEAMELEKEAEIEIRMEKFRNEEVAKIRDEIETRLKFEILQKEKELLRNFENQVTHLKRSLKREKQVWLIERNQKEKELSETRKELVKALMTLKTDESLKSDNGRDRKEDGVESTTQVEPIPVVEPEAKLKPNPNRDTHVPEVEDKLPEKYSSTILDAINVKKELEREFLLKEASLRSAIDKLKTENEWLKLKKSEPAQGPREPMTPAIIPEIFYERPIEVFRQPPKQAFENPFADTIALMKYKIESQSDEIERLRQNFDASRDRNIDLNNLPGSSNVRLKPERSRSDIDTFLEESKRRFAEIDHEARTVELSLNAIQGKKHNLSSGWVHITSADKVSKFDSDIPRLPPSYRKSSLFDESNSRRYEYFPKYLSPVLRKPPPINEYKPILASNPAHHFRLPPPNSLLGSMTSLVGTNQVFSTNSNSALPAPALVGIKIISETKISDSESKTENSGRNYTNATQGQVSAAELGPDASEVQISDKHFAEDAEDGVRSDEIKKGLDAHDSVRASQSSQQDSTLKSTHELLPVEERLESNISENNNNNSLLKSKPTANGHQQKASASGALVKDKISTVSADNEMAKADLSESSISTHSKKNSEVRQNQVQRTEEVINRTWRDILANSSNTSLFDKNEEKETVADIGYIESGDPDDNPENFWDL